ncbi:MAG: hypothetical protein IPO92_17030 [Saprospiraceae bacterium]|nr:hypothetical protein [Saprospiraceae bacterium]
MRFESDHAFIESTSVIDRYKWIFPGGALVTEMMPSTNTLGEYSVQIVGKNGCLSLSKSFYVDLDTRPPGFDVISDTITCNQPIAIVKHHQWKMMSPTNGTALPG